MRRLLTVIASGALMVGMLAGPALAHHDHQLNNPSGCHTVPVSHQDHSDSPDRKDSGNKFHGAAHKGAATERDEEGKDRLGKGNSRVTVDGGACPEAE